MSGPGMSPSDREEARNARIRKLRSDRDASERRPKRRMQPVVFLGWLAGLIALAGILLYIGFVVLLAPPLMSWIEEHPTLIDNTLVLDFVEWYEPEAIADTAASDVHQRITVEIPPGASDGDIGELLFARGVIDRRLAFHHQVYVQERSGALQAGTYDLSPNMLPSELVAALRQEGAPETTITLIEGWRLEQMIAYFNATNLTMNLDEFVELVLHPPADLMAQYDFLAELPDGRSLEGYLFPDTYRVLVNASARQIVELLLNTFAQRLTPELREAFAARGLTIDQAVILASIVEREAVLDAERPLIAGVYIHRLESDGWRLDADPTLEYGLDTVDYGDLGPDEWATANWWTPLPTGGAQVVLPDELAGFQTYQNVGLPPWPIGAPRAASLQAVAFPNMEAGYYFFVAACPNGVRDGSHRFAVSLAEHEANIAQMNVECPN